MRFSIEIFSILQSHLNNHTSKIFIPQNLSELPKITSPKSAEELINRIQEKYETSSDTLIRINGQWSLERKVWETVERKFITLHYI